MIPLLCPLAACTTNEQVINSHACLMPRLVPRLVKALTNPNGDFLTRPGPSHIIKPTKVSRIPPVTERSVGADFATKRTRSILLDLINPILHPRSYQLQKRTLRRRSWSDLQEPTVYDSPLDQLLHEEDVKQRANPYRTRLHASYLLFCSDFLRLVRMLSSSARRCALTSAYMPAGMFALILKSMQSNKAPR